MLSSGVCIVIPHITWRYNGLKSEKSGFKSVELSLSYGRRSVFQFVLVSGSPLGPMTRFYPYPFFSDNCFIVLPVGRPLWREDGSATYSATTDWSGHWGPITICGRFPHEHQQYVTTQLRYYATDYRLAWDCVPTSSPLTTRSDCGGSGIHVFKCSVIWQYRAVGSKPPKKNMH
jgi:hypothetical protein